MCYRAIVASTLLVYHFHCRHWPATAAAQKFAQGLFYDFGTYPNIKHLHKQHIYSTSERCQAVSGIGYTIFVKSTRILVAWIGLVGTTFYMLSLERRIHVYQNRLAERLLLLSNVSHVCLCGVHFWLCILCLQRIICFMQTTWQLSNQKWLYN